MLMLKAYASGGGGGGKPLSGPRPLGYVSPAEKKAAENYLKRRGKSATATPTRGK